MFLVWLISRFFIYFDATVTTVLYQVYLPFLDIISFILNTFLNDLEMICKKIQEMKKVWEHFTAVVTPAFYCRHPHLSVRARCQTRDPPGSLAAGRPAAEVCRKGPTGRWPVPRFHLPHLAGCIPLAGPVCCLPDCRASGGWSWGFSRAAAEGAVGGGRSQSLWASLDGVPPSTV